MREVGSPDIHECFRELTGSQRTPRFWGVTRSLKTIGYTDSDFQGDIDSRKSTSRYVFTLNDGAICWRSVKKTCVADSTTEAEYVAASEAAKEEVWLKKFLLDLQVIPSADQPITLYCDNSGVVA